jgi:hypothetical protein
MADLALVQHQWQRIAALVGTDKLPEFLRHVLNSQRNLVRSQRLFRVIKDEVTEGHAALSLLDELEREADVYSALFDPEHDRWREHKEARQWIRVLRLFNVKQVIPLLLSAYRRFSMTDFVRLAKLCAIVSLRYSIIGRKNPNELERLYNQVAVDINRQIITMPAQVFDALRSIYVSDEEFKRNFTYAAINTASRKRLVRYVLFELERDVSKVDRDFDVDNASIEHVLPEKPADTWQTGFPIDIQENFIHRLGNYTLFEPTLNREVENKDFTAKRAAYAKSQFKLTQAIQNEEWTPAAVTARQEQMAARAAHVWRSDFE